MAILSAVLVLVIATDIDFFGRVFDLFFLFFFFVSCCWWTRFFSHGDGSGGYCFRFSAFQPCFCSFGAQIDLCGHIESSRDGLGSHFCRLGLQSVCGRRDL